MTNPENPEEVDLRTRLSDFEVGLRAMQEVITNLPNTNQAERAIQTDERLNGIGRLVLAGLIGVVFTAGLGLYQGWVGANDSAENKKGIKCIVEQLEEHRNANKAAHMAFADKLDAPYRVDPINQPRAIPHHLEKNCAPFLPSP